MHLKREAIGHRILTPALAVLFVLAALPAVAEGQGHHPGPQGRPEGAPLERMLDRLDLSQEQKDSLQRPLESHREAMESERDRMSGARRALEEAIHSDKFDEASIRRAAHAVAVVEEDMAVSRAGILRDIRKVLTPEQLEKLGAMREKRREMMEERFHGAPGSGKRPRSTE